MKTVAILPDQVQEAVAVVQARRSIHTGRVFELVAEQITLENGVHTEIDVLYHPGAAAIIALTDSGHIPLLRQYRHAVKGYIWEIPAGTRNGSESPEACAQRELLEETGYLARSWEFLGDITPVPGYSNERISLFLATGLEQSKQALDADEVITVYEFPVQEVLDMALKGDIVDAKSLCSLFLASGKKVFDRI